MPASFLPKATSGASAFASFVRQAAQRSDAGRLAVTVVDDKDGWFIHVSCSH